MADDQWKEWQGETRREVSVDILGIIAWWKRRKREKRKAASEKDQDAMYERQFNK